MAHALFDILTGKYANGQAIDQTAKDDASLFSIRSHLSRLFNTRQGNLPHLPDYGLPDIAMYYEGLPHSVSELTRLMKQGIEKYEPRLRDVEVKHKQEKGKEHIIHVTISGYLNNGENAHYSTYFLSGGTAKVEEINQ